MSIFFTMTETHRRFLDTWMTQDCWRGNCCLSDDFPLWNECIDSRPTIMSSTPEKKDFQPTWSYWQQSQRNEQLQCEHSYSHASILAKTSLPDTRCPGIDPQMAPWTRELTDDLYKPSCLGSSRRCFLIYHSHKWCSRGLFSLTDFCLSLNKWLDRRAGNATAMGFLSSSLYQLLREEPCANEALLLIVPLPWTVSDGRLIPKGILLKNGQLPKREAKVDTNANLEIRPRKTVTSTRAQLLEYNESNRRQKRESYQRRLGDIPSMTTSTLPMSREID